MSEAGAEGSGNPPNPSNNTSGPDQVKTDNDKSDSTVPQAQPRQRPIFQPKPDMLQALMDMGITKEIASRALYHTRNHSAEMAAAWIFENHDAEEDSSESSDEEEEDFYKMVFVVNSELNMGVGKISAQVAHAALGLFKRMCEEQDKYATMLLQWEQFGETKIVLRGETTNQLTGLAALATQCRLPHYLVQDAGRTQIAAGSKTVLGIMGRVDQVDEVTGSLKLL